MVGVGAMPMSITVQPTDSSAPCTMRVNMGPETRLSRPTTTRRLPLRDAQAPNAAAKVATTSGVNASPTRPRTPDTLTISPSNAISLLVMIRRDVSRFTRNPES